MPVVLGVVHLLRPERLVTMNSIKRFVVLGSALLAAACGGGEGAGGSNGSPPTLMHAAAADVTIHHVYGALLPNEAVPAPALLASAAPLPAGVDLSRYAMPVGDQGSVGSCVAWTVAYEILGWYANRQAALVATLNPRSFAPMYMYSQIRQLDSGGNENGSYPIDAFNLIINQGNDTRANYTQGDFDWRSPPTQAERANASNFRINSFSTLFSNRGGMGGGALQTAIMSSLANNQPVAIAFAVRPGFEYLKGTAIDNDTTGTVIGYHEVTVIGYDSEGVLIQNHWGTSWGNNGYGRISWNVINKDVVSAYAVNGNAVFPTPPAPNPKVAKTLAPAVNLLLLQ